MEEEDWQEGDQAGVSWGGGCLEGRVGGSEDNSAQKHQKLDTAGPLPPGFGARLPEARRTSRILPRYQGGWWVHQPGEGGWKPSGRLTVSPALDMTSQSMWAHVASRQ